MKPLISKLYKDTHILNAKFQYVAADKTDIRATFERIRNAQVVPQKVRRIK